MALNLPERKASTLLQMRTTYLFATLLTLWLCVNQVFAVELDLLPQAVDLKQLGNTATEHGIPILLVVSQSHCSFCERMKREVLNPMQLNGDYAKRVLMRELPIGLGESITNFEGHREATKHFSNRYRIQVTPTLLFLDGNGNEIAERILGINTVDYLPFYVEDAIKTATRSMAPAISYKPLHHHTQSAEHRKSGTEYTH